MVERYERVKLTNPDKVLYPAAGTSPAVTKADVFEYYVAIAKFMLPHIAGRPVTRKRWPNGVEAEAFFEKQLASSAPDWMHRGSITHKSGTTTYPIIDTREGLAWVAQQASLEVHVPQWRFSQSGEQGPATRVVFDLDPGEGVTMPQLCEVAEAVRQLMNGIGLATYPLTSGSKGLHLYVPLEEPVSSNGASVLAKRIAQQLEKSMPTLVTATMTKRLRDGKVFLDWSQNSSAKTTIAPYSMRGREQPTVAAPRTWDEIGDPDLRHLRFDEVLMRVERDGDLLAALDENAPVADKLTTYRRMRDPQKTPEPVPHPSPAFGSGAEGRRRGGSGAEGRRRGGSGAEGRRRGGSGDTFVIQEHHARRLHYDFRLERDGVLVSWAVPKNLPETTSVNHLAVHTEDHPLEYATFEGSIPAGEYGGGEVIIWDSGTYETEKFRDPPEEGGRGEVIVTLHGSRISGRYALIQTDGKNWLAHRMKEQKTFDPKDMAPMLATHGSVEKLTAGQWAFEGKWDGYRLLVEADHGELTLHARSGRDVTADYPQLGSLAADLAEHHVVLDGEIVALDDSGVPNFGAMQNRAAGANIEFWAFDVLSLDGRSLLRAKYSDRRRVLEALADGGGLIVPDPLPGDGPEALEYAQKRRWEGVVAKKRDSTYQPGRRSASWIKDKLWLTQEVIIGGWRAGEGGRTSGIGALLVGVPEGDRLKFAGRVGTGFSDKDLARLKKTLEPLHTDQTPFNARLSGPDAKGVTFVAPTLVGEVRYSERTSDGRLRQPSWRGMRPDKKPGEVVWE